jgi:hypothetical protein
MVRFFAGIAISRRVTRPSEERAFMSVRPSTSHVKMLVHLEQDEDDYPPTTEESLWVLPLGEGLFQVDNIPFFALDLALEDVVTADPEDGVWRFRRVVRHSGHATLRLLVYEVAEVPVVIERFAGLGCLCERSHIPGLIALDVPPSTPWTEVKRLLLEGEAEERWGYEEACLPDEASP